MNLVHLRLRRGEAIAEERVVEGSDVLYFCGRDGCPHYRGQLALLVGTEAMICALVQHPPDRICQPFYLEAAEDLDKLRRQTWQQRLDEAEAFESAVSAAEIYPDQGRIGGDFLTLALPDTGERILQGVRPGEVRELAPKEVA